MWRCSYICTTRRKSLGHERVFFFGVYCFPQRRNREYDPEGFLCMSVCVCVCVCARVWATCSHYTRLAFLKAVHSLTFAQTSCRYMSSSRWSQINLAHFWVIMIMLPAAENMRSGVIEVTGTARAFLPKRAIHGITEDSEARLNSVRGFSFDGNGYPFVSDWYALVGASYSRSYPSWRNSHYIEQSPHRWLLRKFVGGFLCPFPLFRPSSLGYIGRGVLLSRGNRPPFTCHDPATTCSITRFPTVGSRSAHKAYRVGDYARFPFFDPQTWDI